MESPNSISLSDAKAIVYCLTLCNEEGLASFFERRIVRSASIRADWPFRRGDNSVLCSASVREGS